MKLLTELNRRNVFRVGVAYLVAAWLVAQVVQLASEAFSAPEWIMQMLIVFLVIGFPAILFFSWVYELTPEGLKRETDIDPSRSITHETARRLNWVTIALVLAAVVVVAADRYLIGPPVATPAPDTTASAETGTMAPVGDTTPVLPTDRSIAVLPFVNMSGDAENEYFADGLAEELLNRLAQLPELRVAGRTSSFQYKGRNEDLRDIARELNVAFILEGSVRRSGEQVRITAQLIRAQDGSHLWSQSYDDTLDNVFSTQDEIAEIVATNLDVVMDDNRREIMRRIGVRDVDAFIAYQKGWKILVDAHSEEDLLAGLRRANVHFQRATELYPGFGEAWYWQADLPQHILHTEDASAAELDLAMLEITRLLAAAAEHARTPQQSAYSNLTKAIFSADWRNITTLLERAWSTQTCVGPNWSELLAPYGLAGQTLAEVMKYLECLGELRSVVSYERYHEALLLNDRFADALELADEAMDKFGQTDQTSKLRVQALLALGKADEAVKEAELIDSAAVEDGHWLAVALTFAGRMEQASAAADRWLPLTGAQAPSRLELFTALGRADAANALAARIDARPAGHTILASAVLSCLCGPLFDIEATPNFKARLGEAGLDWPPYSPIRLPSNPWAAPPRPGKVQ